MSKSAHAAEQFVSANAVWNVQFVLVGVGLTIRTVSPLSNGMKILTGCLLLLTFAACGEPSQVTFSAPTTVPKEKRPMVWEAALKERLGIRSMGAAKPARPAATSVRATTPAGWEQLPANPQRFRNAVWRVAGDPQTDCYLTIGVGGGVPFNLQRWYVQQFGKAAAPAVDELPSIDFCGRQGRLVDLAGTMQGKQDWAAFIAFYSEGERVTSLKFTGPQPVLSAQRDAFLSLAASIRLEAGGAAPTTRSAPPVQPGQSLPPNHAPVGRPAQAAYTAAAPAGWVAKADSRRLLHYTFGANSEVYISQLGGDLRPMLDIWRGELQFDAMSDADFEGLPGAAFLGEDAVLMDLAGDWRGMTGAQISGARLVVVARLDGDAITFCKMVGPSAEVSAQFDAFVQFCGSVRKR